MPDDDDQPRPPRGFWSGTIAFGLVSVPVSLFVATRSSRISLRMVDTDGTPLRRVYFCSVEEEPLERDEIVRGYEVTKGEYVLIEDEELDAIAPEKSQEINLERFVDVADIDPIYFDRAYFLAPGKGGSRPYRLLARVMEEAGRAGIATFVMRGKAYLVAIISDAGLLRAETLRFQDELRTPEDAGLPTVEPADADRRRRTERAIEGLGADALDLEVLRDRQTRRLEALVAEKLQRGENVVEAPEDAEPSERESAEIIDLMQVLKQSLAEGAEDSGAGRARRPAPRTAAGKPGARPRARKGPRAAARRQDAAGQAVDLEKTSKTELYERARRLDIPGRSAMSKDELIAALQDAGGRR